MMTDFVNWLLDEMNSRGWTNSELARRAGVVQSTISLTISGKSKPGPDLCSGIARALHIPPEIVFRHAGLLPPLPSPDGDYTELLSYMRRLPQAQQADVLKYAKFQYQQQQG